MLESILMLNRNSNATRLYGFLVGVEIADGGDITPESVSMKLSDALSFVEGVGLVDVECLGEVEEVSAEEAE